MLKFDYKKMIKKVETMTIQFPLNRQRYFQLGQLALSKRQFKEASSYLQAAYTLGKDFPLNFLLVSTLLEAGYPKEALNYAEEFLKEYLATSDYFSLYLQCLLDCHYFVQAQQLINEKMLRLSGMELKKFINFKRIARQKELIYEQLTNVDSPQVKEDFLQMVNFPPMEQLKRASLCHQLTQDTFLECAEILFLEESVHYLVKSLLLEELAILNYPKNIKLLYYGKVEEIFLKDLLTINDTPLYQRLLLILETQLRHVDSLLEIDLQEEIRLNYALLYPFEKEYIKDPVLWVKSFIYQAAPSYVGTLSEEEREKIAEFSLFQQQLRKNLVVFKAK